jgi:hypothetical protein
MACARTISHTHPERRRSPTGTVIRGAEELESGGNRTGIPAHKKKEGPPWRENLPFCEDRRPSDDVTGRGSAMRSRSYFFFFLATFFFATFFVAFFTVFFLAAFFFAMVLITSFRQY